MGQAHIWRLAPITVQKTSPMGIRDIPIKVGMSFEESADYDSTMIQNPVLSDVQELMKLMIKVEVSPFGYFVKKKKKKNLRERETSRRPLRKRDSRGNPTHSQAGPHGQSDGMTGRDLRWQPL